MKLRPPATPLITVDPYFSVWSFSDKLTDSTTVHWTGSPNTIEGSVTVDGEEFRFMGEGECPAMNQEYSDMSALVTDYLFSNDKIVLSLSFFTPLFPDDIYHLSRPVSYLNVRYDSADGEKHTVVLNIRVSEEICIDKKGASPVETAEVSVPGSLACISIGSKEQKMLTRSGDDLRIEWGRFYLAIPSYGKVFEASKDDMTFVCGELTLCEGEETAVLFAYDDDKCLEYFENKIEACWKTKGLSIEEAIYEAYAEREEILEKCRDLSERIYDDAESAGGEKYADLLALAFRQTIAAHKAAISPDGEVLFVSKECFSNGCAATVDVTYPSSPFMLLYNIELLKGTLRPIFDFVRSEDWEFDFAPHDAGQYPLVNGQVYGNGGSGKILKRTSQMPVEECGNIIIMMANITMLEGHSGFADEHSELLEQWVKYLVEFGEDPENQLCTDDFAGHLAHNCNLSVKAIMGIAGYSKIIGLQGREKDAEEYMAIARRMAESWVKRAVNEDGSFRLAFDRADTFSMKYNIIWDKLWGTGLFPSYVLYSEFASNKKHFNAYGMPLDNRASYTKSDWLVWTASLAPTKEEFEEYIAPMWDAYNVTPSRVPMTDWYDTVTSQVIGFRHRSVVGGVFIKLLEGRF